MNDVDARILALFEAHNQRGLARAISRAESGRGAALIHASSSARGGRLTIGLTGPPGVGKSTLCGALIAVARREGKSVGVVSVDPSSPFSHGAILGDRIRLTEHFTDSERLHPLDGQPRALGRPRRRDGRRGRVHGRVRQRRRHRGNRRRRAIRDRDRRAGRHDAGRAAAGQRRLGPIAQGRHPGSRRRLRRQQAGPPDGTAAAARDPLDAGDARLQRLGPASWSRRKPAKASASAISGRRSCGTTRTCARAGSWRASAATLSLTACARWCSATSSAGSTSASRRCSPPWKRYPATRTAWRTRCYGASRACCRRRRTRSRPRRPPCVRTSEACSRARSSRRFILETIVSRKNVTARCRY